MKIYLAFFVAVLGSLMVACSCGDLDLGGGEEDVGQTDMLPADFFWSPEIDNLGEPGWRESQEPWCAQVIYPYESAFDVWSDSDGVYILLRELTDWDGRAFTCPQDCPEGKDAIYVNRGQGWSVFWETPVPFHTMEGGNQTLTGIVGGPVVTTCRPYGPIRFIENGLDEGQAGTEGATKVFIVDVNLAYTIIYDSDSTEGGKVGYFDGNAWGPMPVDGPPFYVNNLWADDQSLFMTGETGTILSLEGSDWKVHDTHTLVDINAVWGFSDRDVWAGGGEGQLLHYDGDAWTVVEWPILSVADEGWENSVLDMWGQDGVLFFSTSRQITMWDGVSFTVLLLAEDAVGSEIFRIKAIWGNSPTELFVAVDDQDQVRETCDSYYLLWWDGSEFHWF